MNIGAINPLALPSVAMSQADELPPARSIYFVLDGNEILYIGQSIRLSQRWDFSRSHHILPKLFERTSWRIAWLECSEDTLLDGIELALIDHFNPPLNTRRGANGEDSIQVTLVMTKDLREKLRKFAKSKRWSMSQAGVALIEEGLEQAEGEAKDKGGVND